MTGEDDLAGGKVAKQEKRASSYEIREESQRLTWKTVVLFGSATFICLFFGALLWLVCEMRRVLAAGAPQSLTIVIAILAAIPTLLAVNLSRMVIKPKPKEDDLENNAWLALGKEVADVIKDWVKKKA